jgi:hypothetical protein
MNSDNSIKNGISVDGHILVLTHTERQDKIRIIKLQESYSTEE